MSTTDQTSEGSPNLPGSRGQKPPTPPPQADLILIHEPPERAVRAGEAITDEIGGTPEKLVNPFAL